MATRIQVREMTSNLSFDGTDDYVTVSTNNFLDTVPDNGSVELWFYLPNQVAPGGPDDAFSFFTKSNVSSPVNLIRAYIHRNTGSIYFQIYYNDTQYRPQSTQTTFPAGWYHYVATWGSAGMKQYINGAVEGTNAFTGKPADGSSKDFVIGVYNYGTLNGYYNGFIDEVRIYNRALSAEEATQHYFNGVYSNESGLVGKWLMDENSGGTAYDTSGNANDGTISGAAWSTNIFSKARVSI